MGELITFKKKLEIPNDSVATYLVTPSSLDTRISNIKNLINSLLDYHFDIEKDEDYIKDNRP